MDSMLWSRLKAASVTGSRTVTSEADISPVAVAPGKLMSPVAEDCDGGGGFVAPGKLMSPAKAVRANANVKTTVAQNR